MTWLDEYNTDQTQQPQVWWYDDGSGRKVPVWINPQTQQIEVYPGWETSGFGMGPFPSPESTPTLKQGPDGNWYQWDGKQWAPAPGMPAAQQQPQGYDNLQWVGDVLYGMSPAGRFEPVPGAPRKPTEGKDPLDQQVKRLQIQKYRQDLAGADVQALQQRDAALQAIHQKMLSGEIDERQANELMAAVDAKLRAGLLGTTPWEQQTTRQTLARGVINDRMGNASTLASSLLSGATSLYGKILKSSNPPYDFDPFAMAKQYTDEMGGGADMAALAKAVLTQALGAQGLPPTGPNGEYLMPARTMPSAVKPAAYNASAGVEQWRPLVAKYFPPAAVDIVLKIMQRESTGSPIAHNPGTPDIPEDSWGLMQINKLAHPQWAGLDLTDPETNIRLAAELYKAAGWSPWYIAAGQLGL